MLSLTLSHLILTRTSRVGVAILTVFWLRADGKTENWHGALALYVNTEFTTY